MGEFCAIIEDELIAFEHGAPYLNECGGSPMGGFYGEIVIPVNGEPVVILSLRWSPDPEKQTPPKISDDYRADLRGMSMEMAGNLADALRYAIDVGRAWEVRMAEFREAHKA